MSQQINLLAPRARQDRFLLHVALVLGAALLAIMGRWGLLVHETQQVQAQVDAQAREIAAREASLARTHHLTRESNQLKAELDALQPEAAMLKPFLDGVRQGSLGRPEGFSHWLAALGRVPHPETWLHQIELRHRGVLMTLTGLGLNEAAIAGYAAEVNRHFAEQGIHLQSLELARPGPAANSEGAARAAAPSPLTFKLH